MPCTPMPVSACRTSSSLKGLMIATTSFMVGPLISCFQQIDRPWADDQSSLASFRAKGTKKLQPEAENAGEGEVHHYTGAGNLDQNGAGGGDPPHLLAWGAKCRIDPG